MAGAVTLAASAVVIAPSVQPLPSPRPEIQLAAVVQQQPLALPTSTNLTGLLQRILLAPNIGTPPPAPPGPIVIPTPTSIDSTIKNVYNAIEPWVQYGFELAAYAVGWIPYVGWLAPQINIFYTFGEQIVRSITFNIADWLGGNISFGQGLVNVGIQTINAFIYLANAELGFWLPPLPPIPPLPCPRCSSLAVTSLADPTLTPGAGVENAGLLGGLPGRISNPLGGASLGSLFKNGLGGFGDLLGDPSSPPDEAKTSEVSTIPSIVKTPFTPLKDLRRNLDGADQTEAGPLAAVTKTVRNVRDEIRTGFNATNQGAAGKDIGTQDKVRNSVANAAHDIVNAVRAGKPGKPGEDATKAPATVAKSLGDSARNAVKQVRQAAKDAHQGVKEKTSADK
jgi:hypothetical protein